jgi:hypothetical protein
MGKRLRFDEKEQYYIKKAIYHRLAEIREQEISEETRLLYSLLTRLLNPKPGAPLKCEITSDNILGILMGNQHLSLSYSSEKGL